LHLLLDLLRLLEERVQVEARHRLLLAEVPHIFDLAPEKFHRRPDGRVIAAGLQALDLLLLAGALLLVVEAGLRRLGRLRDAHRRSGSRSELGQRSRSAPRTVGPPSPRWRGARRHSQPRSALPTQALAAARIA